MSWVWLQYLSNANKEQYAMTYDLCDNILFMENKESYQMEHTWF